MRSYSAKPSEVDARWVVIDAAGQRLGRMATHVAQLLQGKHKPIYTRHVNTGDFVVVVNAAKVTVSGRKASQKPYYRHSGYVGHLRVTPFSEMLERHPDRVVQRAVKGMLPNTKLGRQMLRHLKVYGGEAHPHQAQVNAGQGARSRPLPEKAQKAPRRPQKKEPEGKKSRVTEAVGARPRRPRGKRSEPEQE